jgi:nucleoid DNA-binding protein
MTVDIKDILSKAAERNNISKVHAELIYRSIFELVAETMRKQEGENILLSQFGRFVVPKKKFEKFKNKKENVNKETPLESTAKS